MKHRWYRHSNGLLYPFPPIAGGSPLALPPTVEQLRQTNLTAAARDGTTVTAGDPAHTMGSWTSLVDPTDIASYVLYISVRDIGGSAADRRYLLDVGFGPTGGGGTIQTLLSYLDCGAATSVAGVGVVWAMPAYIPSGVRLQARGQSNVVSRTATVVVHLAQRPLYPGQGSRWTTYGADAANSMGTSVTPGNGAFGAWTQIGGTTSRDHALWQVGYDLLGDSSVAGTGGVVVEVGHGATGSEKSIGLWQIIQGSAEQIGGPFPSVPIYHPVPSGATLWARIAGAEIEARGVIVYGGD